MRLFNWFKKKSLRATIGTLESLLIGSSNSSAGVVVTPDSAPGVAKVFGCVNAISQDVAKLPLMVFKRLNNGGREKDFTHPLFYILQYEPNKKQTAYEFRQMMQGHLLLRGNAYAYIQINGSGEITGLLPLHPDRMYVYENTEGNIIYEYYPLKGGIARYSPEEIFHIRGLTLDGVNGCSALQWGLNTIGLAMAMQEYGSRFFANNAKPGGVLQHPKVLGKDAADRLKSSFEKAHAGVQNAHRVMVLEEGMTWQQVGVTNTDSQFLESRKFQNEEIASLFRMPPHKIQMLDKATFSNIESQNLEYVTDCLTPWLVMWEQAIQRALFLKSEKTKYFTKFIVDALLRGDIKSRYESYATALDRGFMNIDEVRELEDRNPLPDGLGQKHYRPLNLVTIGEEPAPDQNQDTAGGVSGKQTPASNRDLFNQGAQEILTEILHRAAGREQKKLSSVVKKEKDLDIRVKEAETYYPELENFIKESSKSVFTAIFRQKMALEGVLEPDFEAFTGVNYRQESENLCENLAKCWVTRGLEGFKKLSWSLFEDELEGRSKAISGEFIVQIDKIFKEIIDGRAREKIL